MTTQRDMIERVTKGWCPVCGITDVDKTNWFPIEVESDGAYQNGECLNCGNSWVMTFAIVAVEIDPQPPVLEDEMDAAEVEGNPNA